MTCFNRKETTLKCLNNLRALNLKGISLEIFLTDDGSTDGTAEAIVSMYPQVHIIVGDGNLFWNRGMLKAWEYACKYKKYDAYLWLNDDVRLYPGALIEMVECLIELKSEAIICGAFCNSNGEFTYGGKTINSEPIIPNNSLQSIYFLNGNCVMIPSSVVSKIGLLDPLFHHHLGDYDYGLRALEAGIEVVTTKRYIGECEANNMIQKRGRKNNLSLVQRFKYLYSPLGDNPWILLRFYVRHSDFRKGLYLFVALHWNNLLPDSFFK